VFAVVIHPMLVEPWREEAEAVIQSKVNSPDRRRVQYCCTSINDGGATEAESGGVVLIKGGFA